MKIVTVLMSTYNGAEYLSEQIDSLLKQEGVEVSILVRDDGSTDNTIKLLDEYQKEGILTWYSGENLRSAKSFLDLIKHAPSSDYYAFCDQDDVWNKNKLRRAVNKLDKLKEDIPKLYCANYQLVDAVLNELPDNGHMSTTTLEEALIASNCTGCTTVFNRKLLEYLKVDVPQYIVMHDDWAHKVCLALGGKVIYDNEKVLMYRQHGNNVDGGVHNKREKVVQILKRIRSKECIRSKQLEEILRIYKIYIPKENYYKIKMVASYRNKNIIERLKLAFSKIITTSYKRMNRGFRMAIIFKYY